MNEKLGVISYRDKGLYNASEQCVTWSKKLFVLIEMLITTS
jgi:hypothetical protein